MNWNDPTPLTRKEYFHYFSACAATMFIQLVVLLLLGDSPATPSVLTKSTTVFLLIFMYGAYNNYGLKRKKKL